MAKRGRKPAVKRERRLDWLRRHEMGESAPKIADTDEFDVRTVRKHIELAQQEREVKEARAAVLRNALERHYDDLRDYAEKLNAEILGSGVLPGSADDDLMEAALRQHLPRSPIWGYMSKWHSLQDKAAAQRQRLEVAIEQTVKTNLKLNFLVSGGLDELVPGVVRALAFQVEQWSQGLPGLETERDLVSEPTGQGLLDTHYGFSRLGTIDAEDAEQYVETLRELLVGLEASAKGWEVSHDLERTASEIERVRRKLREELAVLRLRRIVPGRCRYCPL